MPEDFNPYGPAGISAPVPPAQDYSAEAISRQAARQMPQPQAPRRKTGLIVALVVGALLLCCCAAAGALLAFGVVDSETTLTIDGPAESTADAPRMEEWLAWDPEVGEPLAAADPARLGYIEEALGKEAPGLTFVEAVVDPGYYEQEDDWYWSDYFLVKATHPAVDSIWAGVEFSIQSDQMVAEDVSFELDSPDKSIVMVDGGAREMVSAGGWGSSRYPLGSSQDAALWRQLAIDWPGAIITRIADDGDTVDVSVTKWRQYAIADLSPRVVATYELVDGEWRLALWDYIYPDDEPVDPLIPDTPPS